MSMHGRVILARMLGLIDDYERGRLSLRALVDDLRPMYESLDPSEQPPEREWLDSFIPLDRATETSPADQHEMSRLIALQVRGLRRLITVVSTARIAPGA